jgi:hypothetical protein
MFIPINQGFEGLELVKDLGEFFIAEIPGWSDLVFIRSLDQHPYLKIVNCCRPNMTRGDLEDFFLTLGGAPGGGEVMVSYDGQKYYYAKIIDGIVTSIRRIWTTHIFSGQTWFLDPRGDIIGVEAFVPFGSFTKFSHGLPVHG